MSSQTNRKAGAKWKETRHDKWYNLAKEQGYRSRAAFKLVQLNKKYDLLSSARSILDLGAAPGGWLQVAVKYMPVSSLIIGLDLLPIRSLRGVTTIRADMTTPEAKTLIKKELQGWDVDLVLHDGAPNVSGGTLWSKDAYVQNELVIYALKLATHFLREGGSFVTKVFRSTDYNSLLWVLKQLFKEVHVTKPLASRNASAEIFIVCKQYIAPKKIDPFLLDPAHIFQSFEGVKQVDLFGKTGKVRQREGYDDASTNSTILTKSIEIQEFISTEDPIQLLATHHSFTFSPNSIYSTHTLTTNEIKSLCQDLKVLGKGDLRSLLKWRKKMREWQKEIAKEEKKEAEAQNKDNNAEVIDINEDELSRVEELKFTNELNALKLKNQLQIKKNQRKLHERMMKNQMKLLLNKNNLTENRELFVDRENELFQLGDVINNRDLLEGKIAIQDISDSEEEKENLNMSNNIMDKYSNGTHGNDNINNDTDDDEQYNLLLEKELDNYYSDYKERRKIKSRKIKENLGLQEEEDKNLLSNHDEEGKEEENESIEEEEEEVIQDENNITNDKRTSKSNKKRKGELLVSIGEEEKESSSARISRWFQRDLFKNEEENGEESNSNNMIHDSESNITNHTFKNLLLTNRKRKLIDIEFESESESEYEEEIEDEELSAEDSTAENNNEEEGNNNPFSNGKNPPSSPLDSPLQGLASYGKSKETLDKEKKQQFFEERKLQRMQRKELKRKNKTSLTDKTESLNTVEPVDLDGDAYILPDLDSKKKTKKIQKQISKSLGETVNTNGSEFEEVALSSDYTSDEDVTATTLALAGHLLNKSSRTNLLDSSYNRYSVDLQEQGLLPGWFRDEESFHNRAQLPVTKEEVDVYRDRLRAINSKPIKKIAEAKRRKKVKMEKKWQKIKDKVNALTSDAATGNRNADDNNKSGGSIDKIREIEKLLSKKDKRKVKDDAKYVITKKGGSSINVKMAKGKGGRIVKVDRRMKKDKRGQKIADRKNKQKKTEHNKRRKM